MRTPIGSVGVLALGILLISATVPGAAERESGLQSETPKEQQQKQHKLQQQNLEEKQRLQGQSGQGRDADIPYTENNQPIGGQKQGGQSDFPQPAFPWVKGELMQIEGEYYVVRDAEGKDVRLHVDKGTKMEDAVKIGDFVEAKRTLQGHAVSIRQASSSPQTSPSSASAGTGRDKPIKDEQVTLGGAKQAIRGEVLKVDGENYVVKDGHGNEVRLAVNQNTRMSCGSDTGSSLLPAPSATDKPDSKGQPQDLARTAEQQGSEVGPGTKPQARDSQASAQCQFKPGEMIEAEISDMGTATFIKQAGRAQPGQPLP
jgi:hypothetical protein